MKILVINGSPKGKRGNTYKLTDAFLEGIKSNAETEIEEIDVNELNIESCHGCFGCWWGSNPGHCVIKDDMTKVIEKLVWAEVIIWSFPLYYYNVPGKLKTLIDRQLPTIRPEMDTNAEYGAHPTRYDFSNQKHVLISTCGFYTAEGNYDSVEAMFNHMYGVGNYDTIFCGEGSMFTIPDADPVTLPYLENVKTAGVEFTQNGITEETQKSLKAVLIPREHYEGMINKIGK